MRASSTGRLVLTVIALGLFAVAADARPTFFEGKTIRIVVGSSPGGGYDLYSRAIARHLGRHIPGKPAVIVENMTGAGSLVAANYLYKIAKPDGLTFGVFAGNLVLGQMLGQPGIEFDGRKFGWLGMPTRDTAVCALTRASGITSLEAWMAARSPVKLGGTGAPILIDNAPRVLAATVGLPIQLVRGYSGTPDIRLAAESGEIAGGCWIWESLRMMWRERLDAGEVAVLLQFSSKPLPDLPHVPLAVSLAKTDEARQIITAIEISAAIARTWALPPGVPADRADVVRTAFADTLRDPEFLSDARRSKMDVDPVLWEELTRLVENLLKLPPPIVARLKDILR